jgi:hypothetical protein
LPEISSCRAERVTMMPSRSPTPMIQPGGTAGMSASRMRVVGTVKAST